jgi:hypothetical protein
MREGQTFSAEENMEKNTRTLSERKGKESQKKIDEIKML